MTTPKATQNLDAAIAEYSDDASALYKVAHHVAVPIPAVLPPPGDVTIAKTHLQSAFSQLTTAASMEADQTDRAGLAAVVQLMQTIAAQAEKISGLLGTHLTGHTVTPTPSPDYYAYANALTSALSALAELSPSAVWTSR